ncbi:MAG: SDR family oxidoreductase [Synechococcales cyanobacterium RM1_1_8]|nr:SDR family oxidoreductase [Synechococcales cyanobacterium RM1_1_8]
MATYLVTGSNRGIGLEYCRQLGQRGDRVIALCRQPSPELMALGVTLETGLELTDTAGVDAFAQGLQERAIAIDVVIHNAAIVERVSLEQLDLDSLRRQFEVNAIAPLYLTQALLPCLSQGAKIALMTSRMGSIADNSSGGSYGYRMSKVALSMAGKSLAHDLKPRGIAVAILHPGLVQTRMTQFTPSGISPEASVTGLLARIDQLTLDKTGSFWHANGEQLPW